MTTTDTRPIRILHLTDSHLFGERTGTLLGVDTQSTFESVVALAALEKNAPDLVLATGDLSQDGSPASYARLQAMLGELGAPVYWLPGNHDKTEVMAAALNGGKVRPDRQVNAGDWNIVLLDSVVPGEVHGFLEAGELEHLSACLEAASASHALVALHHHPVAHGSAWIDGIGLRNAQEFFAVIDRHPQVRAIIWGHVHQDFAQQRGNVQMWGTPSTCFQFKPRSQKFAIDRRSPGCRWLTLGPDGQITTRVQRVAHFNLSLESAQEGY